MADDLQTQIDDIVSRLDENDTTLQDISDTTESNLGDLQTSIEDQQTAIDDIQPQLGQLAFPLSQDTIDLITEQSPTIMSYLYQQNYIGTVVLVAGTKVVSNNLVTANSIIMLTRSTVGGTTGNLSYVASAGTFTITSSSNTDTSTIIYFIIN